MLVNLNDVLLPARKGKYGVGLFNTVNLELARGVLKAAEETNSPVIIGTAEILFPFGSLDDLAHLLIPMAKSATVPVVVHLDHGLNENTCRKAIELGFSSIMYDCSTYSYEENIERVAKMAKFAHDNGVTIEAELGHVGDNGIDTESNDPTLYYTQPEQAKEFIDATKVDALAIAVGTAHGAYKLPPKLDFNRIRKIATNTDIPLVLHGGSGLSDLDFKTAIKEGISKINIFTDINLAGAKAAYNTYDEGKGLTDLIPNIVEAIEETTVQKMKLFNSINKA